MPEPDWTKYPAFVREEFVCNCGCNKADMDEYFIQLLQFMRDTLGFPIIINSGYRCPEYNNRISNTGFDGPHTTGKAVDVKVSGTQAYLLLKESLMRGITGVGVMQHGPYEGKYLHLDILDEPPRPNIWDYG